MARTDNLSNFLTDIANAIRSKTSNSDQMQAATFDTKISQIEVAHLEPIKTVTPSTSSQNITPAQGYNGMSQVTVNAVTASIDSHIIPANIKKDITILGVQGNLEPDKPNQTKTCTPTTSQQTITPDTGYELSHVVVNGVTAAIDSNITAGNIAQNVAILGVVGTYDGGVATALAGSY